MDRKSCPGCARTEQICATHAKKMKETFKEKEQQLEDEIKERDALIGEMRLAIEQDRAKDFKNENMELQMEVKELREKLKFAFANFYEERKISNREIDVLMKRVENHVTLSKEMKVVVESTIEEMTEDFKEREEHFKDKIKELKKQIVDEKTKFNDEKYDLVLKNAQLSEQMDCQQFHPTDIFSVFEDQFKNLRSEFEGREAEWSQEKAKLEWDVYNLKTELNNQKKKEREWQLEKLHVTRSMYVLAIELNSQIEKNEKVILEKLTVQNKRTNQLETTLQETGFKLTQSYSQLKNFENREARHQKQNDEMYDNLQKQEFEVVQLKEQLEGLEFEKSEESQYLELSLKLANSRVLYLEEKLRTAETILNEEQKRSAHTQALAEQLFASDQWMDEKIAEMNAEKAASEQELIKMKAHFENYKKSVANTEQKNAERAAQETGFLRSQLEEMKRNYNAMLPEVHEARRILRVHGMF